ncbi:histidine--tRNA ligase, partial [Candidatus Parcubacteria bacterium]
MEEYEIRKIKPALGSGFRDYLPEDTIPRQRMLRTIRNVLERFGYVPLETPGIEREEVLTGKDPSFSMQIFRIAKFGGESDLALRFDLTVPLARVVAAYPEKIAKPFKRYQVGRVWRGEKPQAGRFREFTQFDADIVGTSSIAADAEIVALMYTVMAELGFTKFLIRVNNRKILNGLPSYVGF